MWLQSREFGCTECKALAHEWLCACWFFNGWRQCVRLEHTSTAPASQPRSAWLCSIQGMFSGSEWLYQVKNSEVVIMQRSYGSTWLYCRKATAASLGVLCWC